MFPHFKITHLYKMHIFVKCSNAKAFTKFSHSLKFSRSLTESKSYHFLFFEVTHANRSCMSDYFYSNNAFLYWYFKLLWKLMFFFSTKCYYICFPSFKSNMQTGAHIYNTIEAQLNTFWFWNYKRYENLHISNDIIQQPKQIILVYWLC